MKIIQRTLVLILLLNVSNVVGDGFKNPGRYLEENVLTHTMKNGITVMMLNRGNAPTVALIISFRVGSSDESYRTIGMAHMLEHMLFKGTDTIGTTDFRKEKKILDAIEAVGETIDKLRLVNPRNVKIPALEKRLSELQKEHRKYIRSAPYSRIYSSNGGVGFNAFTSRDRTAYVIELPTSKLEMWARLESERLRNPIMREFYLERNTVYEERLMRYESEGSGMLYEKFIAAAYIAHPYRHPIIGWRSNIKFLSIQDLKRFYWTHYVPERMTITVVGKQDTKKTVAILEKYFGAMRKRPVPPETAIQEPPQQGERRITVRHESRPRLIVGWHKPTAPSRDDFVCDIISGLLTDGKTSRLYRSLILDRKIASSVSSYNGYPGARYDNLFLIEAAPRHPHTLGELEKALYEEIVELRKTLGTDEMTKVLNRIEASMVFDLDSNMGIARLLSYYQTVFNDWHYITTYFDAVKRIGVEDVRRVLDEYFIQRNRTVGMLESEEKK